MKPAFLILAATLFTATVHAEPRKYHLPPEIVRAMNGPSALTLLSVHPDPHAAHWFNPKFHGYRVLGKIPITDLSERRQILDTIRRVIRDYAGSSYKCVFSPRHGVHLVSGAQTYDFLICFECEEIEAHSGDRRVFHGYIHGSPGILTTLLQAAKIRIAD